jgi:hypothetical protein
MSCKELIDMFREIGGKIICDYYTQKCTFFPKNTSCDINSNTREDLEKLISDFGLKQYVKFYHMPTPSWNPPLERLHKFQIKNTYGMTMEMDVKDKEWYQVINEKI